MDQLVGSLFFAFAFFALSDSNGPFKKKYLPAGLALAIMAVGCAFGLNSNYAVNPARDLGPRIFCLLAGYGSEAFLSFNGYFIIPFASPFMGALLGSGLYQILIGC
jgi:glycerol uptake facilitator-like aquaporin